MKWVFTILSLMACLLANAQELNRHHKSILKDEFGKSEIITQPVNLDPAIFDVKKVSSCWEIYGTDKPVAYLFQLETKGRIHTFTSLVLLSPDGAVLGVRVTNYPSTYGVQITNKRWLGKLQIDAEKTYDYGKNIDAISGATISAKGLIKDIELLRKSVQQMGWEIL
jgi:Na+-translocating ferredoxin:NAD+ oxidoreductase RnfG subunit